jgi:hypothetical protein
VVGPAALPCLARLTGAVVKEIRERKGEERELSNGAHAAMKEKGKGVRCELMGRKMPWVGPAATQGKTSFSPKSLAALYLLTQICLDKDLKHSLNLIPFQIQTSLN